MDLLFADWLGTPLWLWLAFFTVVAGLLTLDLGVLHRGNREIGVKESLALSVFYVSVGVAFGLWLWWHSGSETGLAYLTGFVIEKSLAMDNIFVIAMIFSAFAIPRNLQHRVLFWGVLGVIVLRALMIGAGVALVENFGWVLYLFAAFLIWTGIGMWRTAGRDYDVTGSTFYRLLKTRLPITDGLRGERFVVREEGADGKMRRFATPLLLALLMVEFVDIVFAVDSIPAIFAITTDPFVVYTSNIFAILGLRALYFALAAMVHRFVYLKHALAVLLIFIGSKIFLADMLGLAKFPPALSLGATFGILAAGVGWSLWRTRGGPGRETDPVLERLI